VVENNGVEQDVEDATISITVNFQKNLYGLTRLVSDLYPVAQMHDKSARDRLLNIEKQIADILSSKHPHDEPLGPDAQERLDDTCHAIVNIISRYDYAWINYNINEQRTSLLLTSAFILLVSYFDFLLSDLIHWYYHKYPEALGDKALLTFGELRECSSIDEAIDCLVSKKVESVSFKSFTDQISFFKNELKVPLQEDMTIWPPIQEIILRRNILVHNDGIVNSRYIKGITALHAQSPIQGTRLSVDPEYFSHSFAHLLVGGTIFTQICWRKWFPDQLSLADSKLSDLIDKLLSLKDYDTAYRLAIFSKQITTANEDNRHLFDIYYCLVLKRRGKDQDFNSEITKLEKANLNLPCQVAFSAVRGLRKEFYEYLERAAQNDQVHKPELFSALYEDLRQEEDFKIQLNKIFPY
jgi:hypothetical protein